MISRPDPTSAHGRNLKHRVAGREGGMEGGREGGGGGGREGGRVLNPRREESSSQRVLMISTRQVHLFDQFVPDDV